MLPPVSSIYLSRAPTIQNMPCAHQDLTWTCHSDLPCMDLRAHPRMCAGHRCTHVRRLRIFTCALRRHIAGSASGLRARVQQPRPAPDLTSGLPVYVRLPPVLHAHVRQPHALDRLRLRLASPRPGTGTSPIAAFKHRHGFASSPSRASGSAPAYVLRVLRRAA